MNVTKNETPAPQSINPILTYILLIVVILQWALNLYLLTGNSLNLPASTGIDALWVKRALLEMEYDKVGGKENYELISQATLIQMKEQIPQIKQFIQTQGGAQAVDTPTTTTPSVAQEITLDAVAKILSTTTLEGNAAADIAVIEYSDMECPFCVRQYQETKLKESLLAKYGDKVSFAFKNNRGVNHDGTEAKALGALCARKIGWDDAYVSFYRTVMDGTTQAGWVYPVSSLPQAAESAGVDVSAWQSCIDSKETLPEFAAETQEANGFGLGGTPGTLILNIKTGKYATVEGAYPLSTFIEKIDALMK